MSEEPKKMVSLTPRGMGYCAKAFGNESRDANPFDPWTEDYRDWETGFDSVPESE